MPFNILDSLTELNVNQTPISNAAGPGHISTGPFFAGGGSSAGFQGPSDLITGIQTGSFGADGMALLAGAALIFALILTKKGGK